MPVQNPKKPNSPGRGLAVHEVGSRAVGTARIDYNSEVSSIKAWLRQVSCDGKTHQQVCKLYTGHVASNQLKGNVFANAAQGDFSGNCQSEQQ